MNHILVIDDALKKYECDSLIDKCTKDLKTDMDKHPRNFKYHTIEHNDVVDKMCYKIIEEYKYQYPEINITKDKWFLDRFTFKQFDPGKFYNGWHSEHAIQYPFRILCVIVYLSEHKCGTEFFNGDVIQSKKGRAVVFPTFWTHTHRGQSCPENKTRYIMNSYANLFGRE
jgi:hypothetical protein